jgi:hypothetical protein
MSANIKFSALKASARMRHCYVLFIERQSKLMFLERLFTAIACQKGEMPNLIFIA